MFISLQASLEKSRRSSEESEQSRKRREMKRNEREKRKRLEEKLHKEEEKRLKFEAAYRREKLLVRKYTVTSGMYVSCASVCEVRTCQVLFFKQFNSTTASLHVCIFVLLILCVACDHDASMFPCSARKRGVRSSVFTTSRNS